MVQKSSEKATDDRASLVSRANYDDHIYCIRHGIISLVNAIRFAFGMALFIFSLIMASPHCSSRAYCYEMPISQSLILSLISIVYLSMSLSGYFLVVKRTSVWAITHYVFNIVESIVFFVLVMIVAWNEIQLTFGPIFLMILSLLFTETVRKAMIETF